jgi:primosomal protein N'
MFRIRRQYRYELLIRSPDAGRLMETMDRLRHEGVLTPNSKNTLVDMDPVSLL